MGESTLTINYLHTNRAKYYVSRSKHYIIIVESIVSVPHSRESVHY